ncbi:MAG: ComEA family DNA-binding protein [Planctomycetota bacterium]
MRPAPGNWPIIVVLAAALGGTAWMGLHRPVRYDGDHRLPQVDGRTAPPGWPVLLIDINAAGVAELDLLPGIGPRLAEQIAADRQARGRFATIDDLGRVRGVGPRTLERIRPLAVAEPLDLRPFDAGLSTVPGPGE